MSTTKQKSIAIVTGGGSGIGLAIAEKFTLNGIETVIVGRDKEELTSHLETANGKEAQAH